MTPATLFAAGTGIVCLLSAATIYLRFFYARFSHTGIITKSTSPLILFDFDGVICDSQEQLVSVINDQARRCHYQPLAYDPAHHRNLDSAELFKMMKIRRLKLPILVRIWRRAMTERINDTKPFEGMSGLMDWLKTHHISTGMVTSNSLNNVQAFLCKNKTGDFDFIYSGSGFFSKDRIFKNIIMRAGISPPNIYYIGDETRDIQAGKKAGIKTVAVTWGYQSASLLKSYHPDYMAGSPDELLHILKDILKLSSLDNPDPDSYSPVTQF